MDKIRWMSYTKKSLKDISRTKKHGPYSALSWDNSLPQLNSIEPLTIRSLITLRQHASYEDDGDDGDAVVILLRRLSSLLSNVSSSDESLPIVLLHTSFHDFLTNKEKRGSFYVGLRDAHRQLAHPCLGLLLNKLKFNIYNLESSHLANNNVKDLSTHVDKYTPPTLLYACRHLDQFQVVWKTSNSL